ncbi:PIN domain-containing protein [soil metagenome]
MGRDERAQVSVVLDASAVLAILFGETGGDVVASVSQGAILSAVNAVEVLEKFVVRRGGTEGDAAVLIARLDINVVPFSNAQALLAAQWKPIFAGRTISLADRACLALAMDQALPVLTADRDWAKLDIGVDIRLIR